MGRTPLSGRRAPWFRGHTGCGNLTLWRVRGGGPTRRGKLSSLEARAGGRPSHIRASKIIVSLYPVVASTGPGNAGWRPAISHLDGRAIPPSRRGGAGNGSVAVGHHRPGSLRHGIANRYSTWDRFSRARPVCQPQPLEIGGRHSSSSSSGTGRQFPTLVVFGRRIPTGTESKRPRKRNANSRGRVARSCGLPVHVGRMWAHRRRPL
jgi:hypothetical protein